MADRVAPPRRDTCRWTGQFDGFDSNSWETECGTEFFWSDGGNAASNGAFYCHHCGGLIEEIAPTPEDEDA